MSPKPFYEVESKKYLFGQNANMPEEKVRQWALFELISTYGVPITQLEVEVRVKVGTSTHRADIVIHKDAAPYVVVECKRLEEKDHDKALSQAKSYADAHTMQAPIVVYTNGKQWLVQQKINNQWASLPDLPSWREFNSHTSIVDLMHSLENQRPVFFWHNQSINKENAPLFFAALQQTIRGLQVPFQSLNEELKFGTDNLLRVLAHAGNGHPDYRTGKLHAACSAFATYFGDTLGEDGNLYLHNNDGFRYLVVEFKAKFEALAKTTGQLNVGDAYLIRLIAHLFHYLADITKLREDYCEYIDLSPAMNSVMNDFFRYQYSYELGVSFPDPADSDETDSLKHLCEQQWEAHRNEWSDYLSGGGNERKSTIWSFLDPRRYLRAISRSS